MAKEFILDNAGGPQIRRCQGIAVAYYGFTLGALTLEPSGFCGNLKNADPEGLGSGVAKGSQ